MTGRRARITTVLPTYRRPGLLARALDSVGLQTYAAYEVCVYDNASGDETAEVAGAYAARDARIHYAAHAQNIGSEANFVHGLERVETEFVSFLSDDDMLLPGFYAAAVAALDEQPHAVMAATGVVHANRAGFVGLEPSLAPGLHLPPDGLVGMLRLTQPAWTGTLFRTQAIQRAGLDASTIIDLDVELRLAAHNPILVLAAPGAVLTTDNHFGKCLGWSDRYDRTIRKLESDPALPVDVRLLARVSLDARLREMVYQTGVVAARMGKVETATQAADVLRSQFGDRGRAIRVLAMAQAGRAIPYLGPAYRRLRHRRRPTAADRLREDLRAMAPQLIDRLTQE